MTVNEETVCAMLRARAQASPDAVAFAYEVGESWQEIRWRDFLQRVEKLATALRAEGLEAGEHVGILAATSLDWEIVHHAVLSAGGVVVGLEPHDTSERLQRIANHADLSFLVVGNREQLNKLSRSFLAGLKLVVLIEGAAAEESAPVKVRPLRALVEGPAEAPASTTSVLPDAPATLIYTSGTTGQPKGILYRHDQVTLAVRAITESYPSLPIGARFVSWLPLSNLFQRIMNLAAIATGGTVFLVSNPLAVLKAMPFARPDVFIGVPRFYEKLHAGIVQEIERKPALVRATVAKALDIADRYARMRREGLPVSPGLRMAHRVVDKLVLHRLRQVMGGRVRFMVTGSAAAPVRLLEFFDALGLPLYEAYGLSENIVPMAANRPGESRFGTVGRSLPQNELRLDEDGELLVRGPGVFSGYYKEVDNGEIFTADGFYRTGDYVAFEPGGMLRVVGRKSEIIKTSSGRRLSPVEVESALEEARFVDKAIVFGAGRKCLVAAISLDKSTAPPEWHGLFTVQGRDVPEDVGKSIIAELQARTRHLSKHLAPAGYLLLRQPLTIEAGDLTPNLKLRRAAIEARYRNDIDTLYEEIGAEQRTVPIHLSSF